jgi:hypothetical protein
MNEQLRTYQTAVANHKSQHQFADWVGPNPDPTLGPPFLLALFIYILPAKQSPQLVHLNLGEMQVVDEVMRNGFHMLCRLVQPLLHRVRVEVKDPSCGSDAQSFR